MPLRNLSDADIQAIALAIKEISTQEPMFTQDEIAALKSLAAIIQDTRSAMVKTVVGVVITFLIGLIAVGFRGYLDVK